MPTSTIGAPQNPNAPTSFPFADEMPDELAEDMARLTDVITAAAESDSSALAPVTTGAVGGGKLLRPLLVLGTAHALAVPLPKERRRDAIRAAAAVELLHSASLVHDDVIDRAPLRRGTPTVYARWGGESAIVTGDLLIATAFRLVSELGSASCRLLSATLAALSDGQARELLDTGDTGRTAASYLASIEGKTAALFSTSCALGAGVCGPDPDTIDTMAAFGHHVGMAFQITDDILDLTGSPRTSGKARGTDIVAGVYTLPLIKAVERDPNIARLLRSEDPPIPEIVTSVRRTGAIESCVQLCDEHIHKARKALSDTARPSSEKAMNILHEIPGLLLDRNK